MGRQANGELCSPALATDLSMSICFDEALERAIMAEKQGASFYRALASTTSVPEARSFLEQMAEEEEEHAAALAALRDGDELPEEQRELRMVLPPQSAEPNVDEEELDLREAVELAIEAEKHAAWTYASMGSATEGCTQELFTRLALTEQRHADVLTELLQGLDA